MICLLSFIALIAIVTTALWLFVNRRAALTYPKNIAIALDQLANALLGGDPDETISSVAGKARNRGKLWGCRLCKLLDWIDPRHCDGTIEIDEGRRAVWKIKA